MKTHMRSRAIWFSLVVVLFSMSGSITLADRQDEPAAQAVTPLQATNTAGPWIRLSQVVTGLTNPVYLTHAGDGSGRVFIVEQPGRIRVVQNGSLLTTPFLDITSRVNFNGERGLLSVAFHPQFASNRRFYVYYTANSPLGNLTVAEYLASTGNPNVADPTERILLSIPHSASNHNGGQLQFGLDGLLYISTGDSGGAGDPDNVAQNINSLLGKVLRIDVGTTIPPVGGPQYAIPPGNPFVGVNGLDEIWAYGFRNPWRFSFDRATGQLFLADVGQGAREEIDLVTSGGNYGWRTMEGSLCFNPSTGCNTSGLTLPIYEYSHSLGRSITGGFVYRGSRFPALRGMYLYGDFVFGVLWGFPVGTDPTATNREFLRPGFGISSFGEDESGEVYILSYSGTVYQINAFTVSQFYPVASTSGRTVDISGTDFVSGAMQVTFGGANAIPAANVNVISSTLMRVTVPASGGGAANVNGYLTVRQNGLPFTNANALITTEAFPSNVPDPGNPSATSPEFVLWGDYNGDGTFNGIDVTSARAAFLGQIAPPTTRQRLAIDVNPLNANGSRGNGQLQGIDVTTLRAVFLGQSSF